MSLIKWNNRGGLAPVKGLPTWVDNFFRDDDFFDTRWMGVEMTTPAVNVRETEKEYMLEVAAPGMKKEDFKVEVKNGDLVLSAETKVEKEEKEDNYTRREFSFRSFLRTFRLPDNVKSDNIKATYKDGILNIVLPKLKVELEVPAKQIAVN